MADYDQLSSSYVIPSSTGSADRLVTLANAGTVPTGGLVATKTTRVARVPKGFVLHGYRFRIGDGDTDGAPTLTFKLGDAGDDDRILTTSVLAKAGGETTALEDAGFQYEFTADTDILMTCVASATAAQAAAFKLSLFGTMK